MAQQSKTAAVTEDTVRQRIDTVRDDPTAPLGIGRNIETEEPVTIPRTGNGAPIIITGHQMMGKTTLCQHIAHQRMLAGQGVTYVGDDRAITDLLDLVPDDRTDDITCVSPDASTTAGETTVQTAFDETGPPICAIPTSTTSTDHNTTLTGTHLTAVEEYVAHYPRDHRTQPYTIILDGLARLDGDALAPALDTFAKDSYMRPIQLVVAHKSLAQLPARGGPHLYTTAETLITGRIGTRDADSLAEHHPAVTPDDLHDLGRYQWWVRQIAPDGDTDTPLASPPPHPPRRDSTLDEYCEV
jgi:hypothetical protein